MQTSWPRTALPPSGTFRVPAAVASILVAPLLFLELRNGATGGGFPGVLFAVLWALPFSFVLVATSVVGDRRGGEGGPAGRLRTLGGAVLATLIAAFWMMLVLDQMPCFLGVPNCD